MKQDVRRIALVALAGLLLATPGFAAGDAGREDGFGVGDVAAIGYDALLVRPVGAVGVGVGTLFFGIAGPIGALYGQFGELWRSYVGEPFAFTFTRRLGDFGFDPERD